MNKKNIRFFVLILSIFIVMNICSACVGESSQKQKNQVHHVFCMAIQKMLVSQIVKFY